MARRGEEPALVAAADLEARGARGGGGHAVAVADLEAQSGAGSGNGEEPEVEAARRWWIWRGSRR